MITPLDYFNRYRALPVPDLNGGADTATVVIGKYRLGLGEEHGNERLRVYRKIQADFKSARTADPNFVLKARVHTGDGYQDASFPQATTGGGDPLWRLVRYPYAGKGNPESIQLLLQLASQDGPGGKALLAPADFQEYCDTWLGLDCNGYVGSYLRHATQEIAWWDAGQDDTRIEPNDLIPSIFDKVAGVERTSAADILPGDTNLLVLVDKNGKIIKGGGAPHGHIAISVPGSSQVTAWQSGGLPVAKDTPVPAIAVVESTAAKQEDGSSGLAHSWYHYVNHPTLANKGVILVHRGLNDKTMPVRVKAIGA